MPSGGERCSPSSSWGVGPTGVELAGAIGEMSRFTLARDFRNIDPKLTRIVLLEAGPRIFTQLRCGAGQPCHA
jgi:NADH dehydrogenase FAD-containing subunit